MVDLRVDDNSLLAVPKAVQKARMKAVPRADSSGVYICKSVVNDLRHGNFICKSEGIYLCRRRRRRLCLRLCRGLIWTASSY